MQSVGGWILFGVVWLLVLIGILFYAIAGRKFENLNTVLYIVAGFSGIFVVRSLYQVLSTTSFAMLVAGACIYVVGIIFYNIRKVKYMHFVGNLIMLLGGIYIFLSMFYLN